MELKNISGKTLIVLKGKYVFNPGEQKTIKASDEDSPDVEQALDRGWVEEVKAKAAPKSKTTSKSTKKEEEAEPKKAETEKPEGTPMTKANVSVSASGKAVKNEDKDTKSKS